MTHVGVKVLWNFWQWAEKNWLPVCFFSCDVLSRKEMDLFHLTGRFESWAWLGKDGCVLCFKPVMWGVCLHVSSWSLEMICGSRRRGCPPLIKSGKGHFLPGLQPNICIYVCVCVCLNEEVGGELRRSELSNFLPAHLFPMMKCFKLIAF